MMNKSIKEEKSVKKKNAYSIFVVCFMLITPSLAFAFPADLRGVVALAFQTINIVIPIMSSLAFLLFFWGVAKFILEVGDAKEHAAGRQFMIWGIIGLFVLVSFTGIMKFLSAQFELTYKPGTKSILPE